MLKHLQLAIFDFYLLIQAKSPQRRMKQSSQFLKTNLSAALNVRKLLIE